MNPALIPRSVQSMMTGLLQNKEWKLDVTQGEFLNGCCSQRDGAFRISVRIPDESAFPLELNRASGRLILANATAAIAFCAFHEAAHIHGTHCEISADLFSVGICRDCLPEGWMVFESRLLEKK